jgi:hypothetical protein
MDVEPINDTLVELNEQPALYQDKLLGDVIAIVWTNHHHLMRYATEATPYLMWFNFVHLFSVSLLPLSTAWMAVSRLAPQPVAFYAAVFCLVNATYICLIYELIDRVPAADVSPSEHASLREWLHYRKVRILIQYDPKSVANAVSPYSSISMTAAPSSTSLGSTSDADDQQGTRLAHDTLAPPVRRNYERSDAPGQRAERRMASWVQDWDPAHPDLAVKQDLELYKRKYHSN